jgi:hypothetical protein
MQTAANLSVIVLASSRFVRFRGCKRASTHCRKAQEEDQMINQRSKHATKEEPQRDGRRVKCVYKRKE